MIWRTRALFFFQLQCGQLATPAVSAACLGQVATLPRIFSHQLMNKRKLMGLLRELRPQLPWQSYDVLPGVLLGDFSETVEHESSVPGSFGNVQSCIDPALRQRK